MDVIIAYSVRAQTPKNYEEYFNKNIKLIKINNFVRELHLLKDIKAFFEVRKIIKEEKPDIVHMHSSKAGGIGRLAISSKKVDLFYTPHSYSFSKKDESGLKIKLYKLIEKILGMRNCVTIACSKSEYEQSLKVTKKSMYINNGIDIDDIDNIIQNEPERVLDTKKLKICTVGRIANQKNPELFNKIAEKLPNNEFNWIGDGELKNMLKSPNINILGWCDRDESIKKLYQNDVFILPSLWEGLPITLLEAMYLKKICIVSNVAGNKDVIKNEMDGFICNTEDDYCNIIKRIENDELDLSILVNRAREKIELEHNADRVAEKYLEVYAKDNSKGDEYN